MGNPYAKTFTTPVGRLVGGSLYKPNTTDLNGKPLVFKSGPKIGQEGREDYYFALAVPKSVNPHWASDEWGASIWAVGHAFMANAGQRPVFSWKIADGDSTVADDKGRRPCDREGYAGHWILHISSGFATKIFKHREGSNPPVFDPYTIPDAIKTGYYVQVQINCDSNGSTTQPGVYLNHNMVCFTAFGAEISLGGADPSSAGFGAAPLPAGATLTPPANFNPAATPPVPAAAGAVPPPPGAPATPPAPPLVPSLPPPAPAPVAPAGLVQVPGAQYTIEQCRASGWTDEQMIGANVATRPVAVPAPLPPVGSVPPPPGPAPIVNAPAPVVPNPAFLQVPPPPAAAPAPAARVMLPAAQGVPYEQYKANGWTDAQLVQNGMMAA